jgi:IMP cyclohydrolase
MPNPAGDYPGRQIFLGALKSGEPAFAYFGSGRSPGSQQRYATKFLPDEGSVRIRPLDPKEPFDPFRHYQAVRIDQKTGLVVVSNSQAPVDAVYEAYLFMTEPEKKNRYFLERLLKVIGPEYDNPKNPEKSTSRIVGVIFPTEDGILNVLGITTKLNVAAEKTFKAVEGELRWIPTYDGKIDYSNYNIERLDGMDVLQTSAKTAQELADEIYEMSDYIDPRYGELRVWTVAGVRNGNGPGGWDIARRNRHVPPAEA